MKPAIQCVSQGTALRATRCAYATPDTGWAALLSPQLILSQQANDFFDRPDMSRNASSIAGVTRSV